MKLNKICQWFLLSVMGLSIVVAVKAEIVIDNPFLPWEISGTDKCNQLWKPDTLKVKLGDYAIIEDSFNLSRTVVEAVAITNITVQIKWSLIQTGFPANKLDYIIYTHDRRNGAVIQTATGSGKMQQKDPRALIICHKDPVSPVTLRLNGKIWDTDFFRFTALSTQSNGEISTVDQTYVWTSYNATPLFSVLQIAQAYPNLVCLNGGGAAEPRCQADLYLKTTRLVEYGNRYQ